MTRPQAMTTAKELWAGGEGGWKLSEIRDYLAEQGVSVHRQTVQAWVDPEWAKRRKASLRASQRRYDRDRSPGIAFRVLDDDARARLSAALDRPAPPTTTPGILLALRVEDRLTYNAISKVAARFLGLHLSEDEMRFRLYELGAPKNPKKARLRTAA